MHIACLLTLYGITFDDVVRLSVDVYIVASNGFVFFGLNGCMRNHFKTTSFLEGSWHMERVIELCFPWPVLAIQIPLLIVDPSVTPSIKHFRKRVI